eukprot:4231598-Amphidinium_carterae.1
MVRTEALKHCSRQSYLGRKHQGFGPTAEGISPKSEKAEKPLQTPLNPSISLGQCRKQRRTCGTGWRGTWDVERRS